MFGNCESGNTAGAYTSSVWGIIIFLLILFWVFGSNRNGFGPGNAFGMPYGNGFGGWGWGNNEHTPKDNDARISTLQADMAKDTAILDGKLDLGFRTVLNNADNNANKIIEYAQNQRIAQLERENTKLYINGQNDLIKGQIAAGNAELNHRLDIIQGNMISRPPFYPSGCVPCVTNCCGGDGGCGNN